MNRAVIRLSSVTYAIRAQRILEQHGIRSYVKRVTRSLQTTGCGYGLEINGDVGAAHTLLERSGIRVLEILPA